MIGDTGALQDDFNERGGGFGFLFAAVAGLAATFTACNCVVFAMIPGLACSTDRSTGNKAALKAFGSFVFGVLIVTGCYGIYTGFLGPQGVDAINARPVRLGQAQAVFTMLGLVMLIWGAFDMGYLDRFKKRFSPTTRSFLGQNTVKAGLLGILVGLFAIGRPFPVFREFLTYAASSGNPIYGAAVMMIQGLGQIAVMALLFFLILWTAGDRIGALSVEKPYKFRMISSLALIGGGTYFVYYWGLAFLFDIGGWGFKLGWY
jgi:sulfite exporter TauE/SafE